MGSIADDSALEKGGSHSAGTRRSSASDQTNGVSAVSVLEHHEDDVPELPLDWDGPNDPDNPWNWSMRKRWFGTIVPGLLCLLVTFTSSVYAAGVYDVAAKFNVSITTALLGLSMYVIGLGLGPMFSAPLSEVFGRKMVYFVNLPIFTIFTIAAGLAGNMATLAICRALAGIFGGPALAVSAGSFVDIWDLKTSGAAVTVQALATFLGPALGPVAGGYLAASYGWEWTMWIVAILSGIIMVPLIFLEESYKPVILKRRAVSRGQRLPPPLPASKALKLIFTITLARPTVMLIKEPIVQAVAVYSSFAFAVLFGFFEAYPFVFQREYHMSLGTTGLCFLGIAAGLCFGCAIYLIQDRLCYVPAAAAAAARGSPQPPPEIRMIPAMIGSALMPIGLFWFALTARHDIHWIVPVLAGVPFGAGLVLVFLSAVMYILQVYTPLVAASAIAALGLLRYVLAMSFPLFTIRMFENLGIRWATSIYGFIALAMMPIPWVFSRYGEHIRSKSRFDALKGKE